MAHQSATYLTNPPNDHPSVLQLTGSREAGRYSTFRVPYGYENQPAGANYYWDRCRCRLEGCPGHRSPGYPRSSRPFPQYRRRIGYCLRRRRIPGCPPDCRTLCIRTLLDCHTDTTHRAPNIPLFPRCGSRRSPTKACLVMQIILPRCIYSSPSTSVSRRRKLIKGVIRC